MNDENKRELNVPLGIARERDLARRGLVGVHKRKLTDAMGSIVDETAPELQAFEYDKKAFTLTNDGALINAPGIKEYLRVCAMADEFFAANALGNIQILPAGTWTLYKIQSMIEAGKITQLVIKAQCPGGKAFNNMPFYLLRRHPNDPNFVQEDIIYENLNLIMNPPVTNPGHPWGIWLDQKLDIDFIFPYPRITGQFTPGVGPAISNATLYFLYVLCLEWRLFTPATYEDMRVYIKVEDRGRE